MTGPSYGAVSEGVPEPLGVSLTADGINVAVWSAHADSIELCLFDAQGDREVARIPLAGRTGPVFHAHITGLGEATRYGLRAHGPFAPEQGHRFNPHKLLIDPYAAALDRPLALHPALFGYDQDDPQDGASQDEADSAPFMPKAVVTRPPAPLYRAASATPWGETVIYELHVRGFTKLNPDIPEALRGTFAGLAHPAAIDHLKRLGVTTVELMPASAWIDERHLPPLGLSNYWGYNPVAYLAPDPRLAPGGWAEVRAATDALAAAGIETLLDVVFNHTGEGDQLGPTLSLRGLDNASYYHLNPADLSDYVDDTGTGNTLALDRPINVRLVMDTLRAWRRWGGVDGFRFDLAPVLGRRPEGYDPAAPLLSAIDQDPELRELKLIAEPWDIGPGGYQLGNFPANWGEWNDQFRDTVRGFWRGDGVSLGAMTERAAGSQDLFGGRRPSRSINFVTAHDGFTLADLVAYAGKHNEANGEQNRDGTGDNRSWNHGVEGPTEDAAILAARRADQRALLASLLLARGTPMLSMGAETGQSQGGNNNAYAQDNAISWLDWAGADTELAAFAGRLIAARRAHPALHADRFLTGQVGADGYADAVWLRLDGAPMQPQDWDDPHGAGLMALRREPGADGPDQVLLIYNRGGATQAAPPEPRDGYAWRVAIDTADPAREGLVESELAIAARSVTLLVEAPAPGRASRGADPAVLARLSEAAGIAPEWWTLEGAHHKVSPDTQRALLAAMGYPVASTDQALESLGRLAEAHDRRPLPFMVTAREGQGALVRLAAAANGPAPHTWLTVEGEDGQILRLRASPRTGTLAGFIARDSRPAQGLTIALPPLPPGRYRLRREDAPGCEGQLTVAPAQAWMAPALAGGRRAFGLTAQIYSLRRDGDQGLGDFTTLGLVGAQGAKAGAAILGFNPLHALFGDDRERASPYYPSDRRFLDPIYLDLAALGPDLIPPEAAALGERANIDYPAVWAIKAKALEQAFAAQAEDPRLEAFIAAGGASLRGFAAFEAMSEAYRGQDWRQWPQALRDPDSPGVEAFAQANARRVRFHQYLQWLCDQQLAAAADQARGLSVGLARDLAVGAAPDGAEVWAHARLLASGVSIGAPPDLLGPQGQVWALPPMDPHRMIEDHCAAMRDLFAANMRHAGALRIDHVLGLSRLFWVPDGAPGSDGAYVAAPLEPLLAELALESHRAQCMIIGEDLGTVPPGLRETLGAQGVLSYRVLPFERDGSRYRPPAAYPPLAFACAATHDLPPLAGWWEGLDIAEREHLGLFDAAEAEHARQALAQDKQALVEALTGAGVLDQAPPFDGPLPLAMAQAIHAFVGKTPSLLAVAQVEDLAGERQAVNLPGTNMERPNWRRRVGAPIETLFDSQLAQAVLDALRHERLQASP